MTGPTDPGRVSLDVAAWHLQMLLTSVSSFDGKLMFLTALNVAGLSALIGVVITTEPMVWLATLGFVFSSVCVSIGLGVLWSANLLQFPSPDEALTTYREVGDLPEEQILRYFDAIHDASAVAEAQLLFRIRAMRSLLLTTPFALAVAIATAVTAVS